MLMHGFLWSETSMLIERNRCQLLLVDMQTGLAPAMTNIAETTNACCILLEAAREVGIPVVISEQYPKGLGRTLPALAEIAQTDERFEKVEFSCFANPELRTRLNSGDRNQTIIAGMEAHVCVLQTALEMSAAGCRVFVVADAVTSRRPDSKSLALQRMSAAGIDIVSTEMVLFEWLRSAAVPEFKQFSRMIR